MPEAGRKDLELETDAFDRYELVNNLCKRPVLKGSRKLGLM
jgi:hypothetical protein